MTGAGGVDIVGYLRNRCDDPNYRCVVLAHPCSGTTWLTDVLNDLGVVTLHELVRPGSPSNWNVLITYRAIGWSMPCDERLHLVRNPIHTLESAAQLYAARPRVSKDAVAHILGDGLQAGNPQVGDAGPLALAAWTLSVFNQRAEPRAEYRFRIEDAVEPDLSWIPEPRAARRNSHKRVMPGLTWDELKVFRDPLHTQYRRYGYPRLA